PRAHSLVETEAMARAAVRAKAVTQMGNQHHASDGYRRAVQILQAGSLGPVRDVLCWTTNPIWKQGLDRPEGEKPVPAGFDWDLWLGPAPWRPYHEAYREPHWRGWWDFGGGTLADYLPHLFDPIFEGLRLTAPLRVSAETSETHEASAPAWSVVQFEFPARDALPPVTMRWYDGGRTPPVEKTGIERLPPHGSLVLGERGNLYVPSHGKPPIAIAANSDQPLALPDARPPGATTHWQAWAAACKSRGATASDFNYGAALTDVALVGNLAIRTGESITWDAAARRVTNVARANDFVHREYRRGWSLD
ncbi:MAG: gfo/Idh/MocA family oxidoreductase, partial [Planctomycetales bacterium]|nr:gfo/Idh/MocA family oxidoreductase [Planctomycetales bacterium]